MYIDFLTDEAWAELEAEKNNHPPCDPQDLSWFYDLVQPLGEGLSEIQTILVADKVV